MVLVFRGAYSVTVDNENDDDDEVFLAQETQKLNSQFPSLPLDKFVLG